MILKPLCSCNAFKYFDQFTLVLLAGVVVVKEWIYVSEFVCEILMDPTDEVSYVASTL